MRQIELLTKAPRPFERSGEKGKLRDWVASMLGDDIL